MRVSWSFRAVVNRLSLASILALVLCSAAAAQVDRSWVKRSLSEAEKLLADSPWARTQTETEISELFYSPTRPGASAVGQATSIRPTLPDQQSINNSRADRGAVNGPVEINYRISFFSARPVREAISRIVLLRSLEVDPDLIDRMQTLVDRDFSQYVVVNVNFASADGRFLGPAIQAFAAATADTLRNRTFLERKDGKRLFLTEYRAPGPDGLGAKFVFLRQVDGQPFLNADSGTVRFYSEIGPALKLSVRYKVSDMLVNGKLEY